MVQSPSWAASWFAASQEILRISRIPKVHYRTHKRPFDICSRGHCCGFSDDYFWYFTCAVCSRPHSRGTEGMLHFHLISHLVTSRPAGTCIGKPMFLLSEEHRLRKVSWSVLLKLSDKKKQQVRTLCAQSAVSVLAFMVLWSLGKKVFLVLLCASFHFHQPSHWTKFKWLLKWQNSSSPSLSNYLNKFCHPAIENSIFVWNVKTCTSCVLTTF